MSAPGYGCEFCGGQHPVNWLVTRLAPSATVPLCAEDFPVGIIPLLAVELGVPAQGLYDAVKRFTDREAAKQAKAETEAAEADLVTTPDGMITQAEIRADDAVQEIIATTGEPTHEATGKTVQP